MNMGADRQDRLSRSSDAIQPRPFASDDCLVPRPSEALGLGESGSLLGADQTVVVMQDNGDLGRPRPDEDRRGVAIRQGLKPKHVGTGVSVAVIRVALVEGHRRYLCLAKCRA